MPITDIILSFKGRLSRRPFLLIGVLAFGLGLTAIDLGVRYGDLVLATLFGVRDRNERFHFPVYGVLLASWATVCLWPTFAIGFKRFHDRGRSGWFLFAFLPPWVAAIVGSAVQSVPLLLVGAFATLVIAIWTVVELGFLRGTAGANRFGPDPLVRDEQAVGESFT